MNTSTKASTPKTTWSPCTPLCAFRSNPVAASIDTPLHGFLPFPHVDHLHPDWGIALAASANGKAKMAEFNREFNHSLVWLPWQRPGFALGLMMRRAVAENPGCDGIVLGGHGLFTWGGTQRECYLNTLTVIDRIDQFIERHATEKGPSRLGGQAIPTVVLIQGLGMFSFGKNKTEARIVGEFYANAIHVMEGATLLAEGEVSGTLPQCGIVQDPAGFKVFSNYVALPAIEASRIEYWAMEEAKIRRQLAEKELSRRIVLVVGGGSGIGREVALLAAARGAHVVVADRDEAAAARVAVELQSVTSREFTASTPVDIRSRVSASLHKYKIPFDDSLTDDELRNLLAGFYAQRTLTHQPIDSADCAEAILFLGSPRARCTNGHLFPVDGDIPEAFLR